METDRSGKPMTLGHICCSLGHGLIDEEFLNTDHKQVMIFEDDVVTIPEAETELDEALKAVPVDPKIFFGVGSV